MRMIRRVFVYACGALVFVFASPKPALFAAGATLAILGELLRIWACGHLRKNKAVVKTGPYAHVKNPLYLGTFLILVGVVVAATRPDRGASRYVLLVALPFMLGGFFFYYLPRKFAVEGDRLRRHVGAEWDEYDRRVPDFIPSPLPRVHEAGRWNARLVAENSEVSAAFLLLSALILLGSRLFVSFHPW